MAAPNTRSFSEKVALVTDGANEVGRAVALQLALQGCYVIVGFPETSAENSRALAELQSLGTLAKAVEADISSVEGVANLFRAVEESYGRLDLLVNTANFVPRNSFLDINADEFAEIIKRNLKATFFACQNAVQLMKNRPSPAIVNVLFAPETIGNPLFSAVNLALIGFTKSLAIELAPKIRVNAVAVNFSLPQETEIVDEFDFISKKEGVSPADTARAVTYFLSAEAKAITGQILAVSEKRAKI